MRKIKICTAVILMVMTMAVLAACSTKDSDMNQTANPSTTQSTSGTNQNGMNESGAKTTTGSSESGTGSSSSRGDRNGADEESSTGVIGGMIDDVEEGVDDMLDGDAAGDSR